MNVSRNGWLLLCFWHVLLGAVSPQLADKIIIDGREFKIAQVPMLGWWDYGENSVGTGKVKPPKFDLSSPSNWKGYEAVWEIRDGELYLKKIVGSVSNSVISNEMLLMGKVFPCKADWFSGKIHLSIFGYDEQKDKDIGVIILGIDHGKINEMAFESELSIPSTWNGM